MSFLLTFSDIPFLLDQGRVIRMSQKAPEQEDEHDLAPRKHQPLLDLIDELDRRLPFRYLRDFSSPEAYPGHALSAVAFQDRSSDHPDPTLPIGTYYYPVGACRWSVFRGLASSTQVKAMLAGTRNALLKKPFRLYCLPDAPGAGITTERYAVETELFMLPPRPLAEHGAGFDGLYLVTLVDERYFFQNTPVNLRVTKDTTWANLIAQLDSVLGVEITVPTIDAVYSKPEPDSQLWCSMENAPVLLDAIAYCLGRSVVRGFDGVYRLLTPEESLTIVQANYGNTSPLARTAGGDIFSSGLALSAAGALNEAKNPVVPATVRVSFPKYIYGDDPVPHFMNSRYANQRPSCRYEDSPGEVWTVDVPTLTEAGTWNSTWVSGINGVGTHHLHCTAKALFERESFPIPDNQGDLNALALRLAQDHWQARAVTALDESFPGTLKWTPEGVHDIVWTYSARARQASTRVLRTSWNHAAREVQITAPPLSPGFTTTVPKGVGGPSVALTVRDETGAGISTTTVETMLAAQPDVELSDISHLPTQNRWRGQIDDEIILFEGTSGQRVVDVVQRGIDGTIAADHDNLSPVTLLTPNVNYGTNLKTYEKGQWIFPSDWTSGGIQGLNVVPQVQTVQVMHGTPVVLNGASHYSGSLKTYDPSLNLSGRFQSAEPVWLLDRNERTLTSGKIYGGLFAGFSAETPAGTTAPVYLTTDDGGGGGGGSFDLTVRETNGFGIATNVHTIYFDHNDGFIVTEIGIGEALINFTGTFTETVIFEGDVTFNADVTFVGNIFLTTNEFITNETIINNFNIINPKTRIIVNDVSEFVMTGIAAGEDGQLAWIINAGSPPVKLSHLDPNAGGKQIYVPWETQCVLGPQDAVPVEYDAAYNGGQGIWRTEIPVNPAFPIRRRQTFQLNTGNGGEIEIGIADWLIITEVAAAGIQITGFTPRLPGRELLLTNAGQNHIELVHGLGLLIPEDYQFETIRPGYTARFVCTRDASAWYLASKFQHVPVREKGDLFTHNGTKNSSLSVGVTSGMILQTNPSSAVGMNWTTPPWNAGLTVTHNVVTGVSCVSGALSVTTESFSFINGVLVAIGDPI